MTASTGPAHGLSATWRSVAELASALAASRTRTATCAELARQAARDHNVIQSHAVTTLHGERLSAELLASARTLETLASQAQSLHSAIVHTHQALIWAEAALARAAAGPISATHVHSDVWDILQRLSGNIVVGTTGIVAGTTNVFGTTTRALTAATTEIAAGIGGPLAVVATSVETITTIARLPIGAAVAAAGAGAATGMLNATQSLRAIAANPLAGASWSDAASQWADSDDDFARIFGTTISPTFDATIDSLLNISALVGAVDEAHLLTGEEHRKAAAAAVAAGQAWRDSPDCQNLPFPDFDPSSPDDIPQLLASLAELDARGGSPASCAPIRVLSTAADPPAYTVQLPSTRSWDLQSATPNDLGGNLNVMAGDSAMLRLADQALERCIIDDLGAGADTSAVSVMVAGFSQGGITAATFASAYHDKYRIDQVIAAGAPIARVPVPSSTRVLAYEYDDDVVPQLDLAPNPSRWTTVTAPGGGHKATAYAALSAECLADATASAPAIDVGQFLDDSGTGLRSREFYGVRDPEAADN